jgi:S1-C subfamily serine protease
VKLIRLPFLFIILSILACNMPSNTGDSNDMAKWFDVGYDGSAGDNDSSALVVGDTTSHVANVELPSIPIGEALKGTYTVVVENSNGELHQGSGFLLDKNLLVTNHHVIDGFQQGFVRINDKSPKYAINEVLKVDVRHDVAIVRVESINNPFVLSISKEMPQLSQRIYALGCPKGLEGTMSSGIISQFREMDGNGVCEDAAHASFYQTDVQITNGSSGGPVVNEKGHVIGIAVSGFGSGLNFLIPARFIEVLNQGTY